MPMRGIPRHIILRYCVDKAMMSEGVSRTLKIHDESEKPRTAMKTDATSIMYALFTITFLTLSSSLAPKYLEAVIPPPLATPMQNEKNKKEREPVEPTAARASGPTTRPTIAESARL